MSVEENHTFTAEGESFSYTLFRKKIKNINLRVMPDGTLRVSAPLPVPLSGIENFLRHSLPFIRRARKKQTERKETRTPPLRLLPGETVPVFGIPRDILVEKAARNQALLSGRTLTLSLTDPEDPTLRTKVFEAFVKKTAARILPIAFEARFSTFFPIPEKLPALSLRKMTAKWGLCRAGALSVSLNTYLVLLPPVLCDYVICHEYCHFRHPDHSPAFWNCLTDYLPDAQKRRQALRDFRLPRFAEPDR